MKIVMKELKTNARILMTDHFGSSVFSAFIIIVLTSSLFSFSMKLLSGPPSVMTYITAIAILLILSLFFDVLRAGIYRVFIKRGRGEKASLGEIFHPFTVRPDRFLVTALVLTVADVVCVLPAILSGLRAADPDATHVGSLFITNLLLLLAGLIILVIIRLSLAQAMPLLLEYPEMGAFEAMALSMRLMKGHRLGLLRLHLGFIGWYMLACLSMGMGFFLVLPYHYQARALFYVQVEANE
ncbi:MAG: DUF975 family protein [Lachnospiraceae bacterium]|nr:DUF975 family protein [Lachnospiraceae bacterium]